MRILPRLDDFLVVVSTSIGIVVSSTSTVLGVAGCFLSKNDGLRQFYFRILKKYQKLYHHLIIKRASEGVVPFRCGPRKSYFSFESFGRRYYWRRTPASKI